MKRSRSCSPHEAWCDPDYLDAERAQRESFISTTLALGSPRADVYRYIRHFSSPR